MATNTFQKINGNFQRVLPPVLTQGQNFTDPAGRTGVVNFDTNTGQRLLPGATTPTQPTGRTLDTGILPTTSADAFNRQTGQPNPTYTPPQAQNGSTTTPNTKPVDSATAFNLLIMDALKKAQSGTDNTDLLKQQRELSRESIRLSQGADVNTTVPGLLGGMSPSQYNSVRSAQLGALSGSIDENAYQLKKIENEKKNLLEQIRFAQEQGNKIEENALKAKIFDLDQLKYEETVRSNKASERISGMKAGEGSQPGENPQLYSGLSAPTATAVRAQVNQYKTEPSIQNFAIVQEGKNFANSMSNTTTNPADDQGLIYALAKALDPGSVVREGEYATAQKYSQSWVAAFGKGVTQALLGTGFLSQSARENIKKTIEQKYQASKKSYDNLYKQYGDTISTLTGRGDGTKFLKDYSISTGGTGVGTIVEYQGKQYSVDVNGDMTPL